MNNPLALDNIRPKILRNGFKKSFKLNILEQYYEDWLQQNIPHSDKIASIFIDYVLQRLNIDFKIYNKSNLNSIPQNKALIIVSNHPLGGLEGMILSKILLQIRPDLKVLANKILLKFPEFSDLFIPVDILNKNKELENSRGILKAAKHLKNNGSLLIFPSGMVSTIKLPSLQITDPSWNKQISRLAEKYNANILPINIDAQNNLGFYLSEYIHKKFRTALLPRAMLSKKREEINIHIGKLIINQELSFFKEDTKSISYLNLCSKLAKNNDNIDDDNSYILEPIKTDISKNLLLQQINKILDYKIIESGDFELYCAPYNKMGCLMQQLAIEREKTFRESGEGSGKSLDLDQFDQFNDHLFLWHKKLHKIAGSYRIAKTDVITKERGIKYLYSNSLFDYHKSFLKKIGKAIEVGRSFIIKDFQKNPKTLDLLWKGLGCYINYNPDYHIIIGSVSISPKYPKVTTSLLIDNLLTNYGVNNNIKSSIKSRYPFYYNHKIWDKSQILEFSNIAYTNKLINYINQGQSMPILIRHYLSLGAKFIDFSVNPNFNNSPAGLILVDLKQTPKKYLKRYLIKNKLII